VLGTLLRWPNARHCALELLERLRVADGRPQRVQLRLPGGGSSDRNRTRTEETDHCDDAYSLRH
jgi:hypothetical protein